MTPQVHSLKHARRVTSAFHRITHALENPKLEGHQKAELEAELQSMGGRAVYQAASVKATSDIKHTSKWMFSILTKLGVRPKSGEPALKTLEVGAVNTQVLSIPWLDVLAIDLRSTNPKIKAQDFLQLACGGQYQVIMCSMVINCVPTAAQRGEMLVRLRAQLATGGHLFLMLPRRCLTHSKHCSAKHLRALLRAAGFTVRHTKDSPRVSFFCVEATDETAATELAKYSSASKVVNPGKGHSDSFAVCFEPNVLDQINWIDD